MLQRRVQRNDEKNENKKKKIVEKEDECFFAKKFWKKYRLIVIFIAVLFAGGEGGIEAFYPKNVATALDTIINTQTARTSISIQKDFTIKYATAMKHKA